MIIYALREKESGKFLTVENGISRHHEGMDDMVFKLRTAKSDMVWTTPKRERAEAVLDRDKYIAWDDLDRPRIDFDGIGVLEIVEFAMLNN